MAQDPKASIPEDSRGNPYDRAMGLPVMSEKKITNLWRDIFDLTAYGDRVFIGMSVYNPDNANSIYISVGQRDSGDADICMKIPPSQFLTLDDQSFGYGFFDEDQGFRCERVRAKLSAASGTSATGTFDYDNSSSPVQPANGTYVTINGQNYEFTSDASTTPGNIAVTIGASADITWTSLTTVVNANDSEVELTINTTSNIVTVTSNLGGTDGNAQTISAVAALVTAGVVVSGATLSSGANGLQPTIHIW